MKPLFGAAGTKKSPSVLRGALREIRGSFLALASETIVVQRARRWRARVQASRVGAQKGQFPGFGRSVRRGFAPTGTKYVTTACATLPVSFLTM